jgi:CRP-like cAMP-binding protein
VVAVEGERREVRLGELAQAVMREPRSIPQRLDLAAALLEMGRKEEAISLFRDVALSYAEDGKLVQAMAVCRAILEIDPGHEDTLAVLTSLVERRGNRPSSRFIDEQFDPGPDLAGSFDEEEQTAAGAEPDWASAPRVANPIEDEEEEPSTSPEMQLAIADPPSDDGDEPEEPTNPGGELPLEAAHHDDPVAEALERSHAESELPADLPSFPLLSDLPPGAFLELLRELNVVEHEPGAILVAEGTTGDAFYLIVEGTVRVKKAGSELALLGPGSFFGEFAVLADQQRHATVEAVTKVELLEVTKTLLDRLVAEHPGVARTLRAFYADRLMATMLQTAPFFAGLTPEERAEVATRFRPRRFGRGATIIEEGSQGGGMYLILVGEVEVVRSDEAGFVELGRLGEGSYIGEMSLLRGSPASATVRATRLCETVQLPPRDFYEVVSRHPLLWDKLRSEAQRRELTNVALLAGEARNDDAAGVYLV